MPSESGVRVRSGSGMLNYPDEFTEAGLNLASSSVKLLDETVGHAAARLQRPSAELPTQTPEEPNLRYCIVSKHCIGIAPVCWVFNDKLEMFT